MAQEGAKALEATHSTDTNEDNSQNSDRLLSAFAQMQTSFQAALAGQTNSLLRFFDGDKGRKSARQRSRSSDNELDDSGDSEFVFKAPKRAKYSSKSRVNSSGKDEEENEQGCQPRN